MADLSKTETKILTEAAARDGLVTCPETLKPSTRERVFGRLVRDGLVATDDASHRLLPAGYQAIGLRPPRARKVLTGSGDTATKPRVTKNDIVLELLGREEGASLAELIAETGWLPHTTRAALSRIRSAGKPLAKTMRDEGVTVYRLIPEPAPVCRTRKPKPEAASAAAA